MGRSTADEHKPKVRHGRLRRSNGWLNFMRIGLTTLLVVGLSGIATVAYAVWGLTQVKTVEMPETGPEVEAGARQMDGAFTILLVGSDTREGQAYQDGEGLEGELNDVTMMLHVSADHQNATVVSFPRDLMIPIPSCPGPNGEPDYYSAMAEQQINTTLSEGGLPCVATTIASLTDMEIPYAGLITFDGVTAVTNALGGVDVCLTEAIYDEHTGLDLPAGNVTLAGNDALQFLRTRHGVGDGGDTSRISNQQVYMSALVRQLQSAETLSDPVRVYSLAKAGLENMTLSSNMATVTFMQAVAGTLKDIQLENINFVQYPSYSHPSIEGRLVPDYENAALLFDVLRSGQSFDVTSTGEGVAAADGSDQVPVEEVPVEEAPVEEVPVEEVPVEEVPVETGRVELPPGITGQAAGKETCSQGRTVF